MRLVIWTPKGKPTKAKHERLRLPSVTQMVFTMNSERKVDMADVDHIGERETGSANLHAHTNLFRTLHELG
jgi:hypothetical protein